MTAKKNEEMKNTNSLRGRKSCQGTKVVDSYIFFFGVLTRKNEYDV